MHAQVLFRDAAEEGPQEVARQAARRLREVPLGAADYLLDQREAGGGDLAEHAFTLGRRRGGGARDYTYGMAAAHSACAGPISTARPSNTRTSRSSVAQVASA